jgi:hypothetical protein
MNHNGRRPKLTLAQRRKKAARDQRRDRAGTIRRKTKVIPGGTKE